MGLASMLFTVLGGVVKSIHAKRKWFDMYVISCLVVLTKTMHARSWSHRFKTLSKNPSGKLNEEIGHVLSECSNLT